MVRQVSSTLSQYNSKIANWSIESDKCWPWSIQPLVIWIRILGVDLPGSCSTPSQMRNRRLMILYGIFCLIANLSGQFEIFFYLHVSRMEEKLELSGEVLLSSTTATWNSIIDFSNYAIHGIGSHIIFLLVIRPRWSGLMDTFQGLKVAFNDQSYKRIRKFSIIGIGYIVLWVAVTVSSVMNYHILSGSSARRLGISLLLTLSAIYPMTALLLFVVLCYASSHTFQFIQSEIKRSRFGSLNDGNQQHAERLLTYRRLHILSCSTVDAVNFCFGFTFLLSTAFFFLTTINSSFYIFGSDYAIPTPDIIFTVTDLLHLTIMCFAADHVRSKAEEAANEILKMAYCEPLNELTFELMNLLSSMIHSFPQISAIGYFNISKKLIPQVMGVTITYFFIMYQFESAETN